MDRTLAIQLAETTFIEAAHNVVQVGGPGTGKSHLATAIGVAGITRHGKRVRFQSLVDMDNALEQENSQGKCGRIAGSTLRLDATIMDELGHLLFSQAGGAMLFHLLNRSYEHASVLTTTNLNFAEWSSKPVSIQRMPRSTMSVIHGRLARVLATNRNRPSGGSAGSHGREVLLFGVDPGAPALLECRRWAL